MCDTYAPLDGSNSTSIAGIPNMGKTLQQLKSQNSLVEIPKGSVSFEIIMFCIIRTKVPIVLYNRKYFLR